MTVCCADAIVGGMSLKRLETFIDHEVTAGSARRAGEPTLGIGGMSTVMVNEIRSGPDAAPLRAMF